MSSSRLPGVLNLVAMHYYRLGEIPDKRHTQFRQPDGSLYHEQLFSTEGFSDLHSLLYHRYPPTQIVQIAAAYSIAPEMVHDEQLKPRCLAGFEVPAVEDHMEARIPLLTNPHCTIHVAAPKALEVDYFWKNADADELYFIHEGSGILRSMYGNLLFKEGDYVLIPRGTIYTIRFNSSENRLLIVESSSALVTPRRYRNDHGQLMEHAPFCERDIRKPSVLETHDETGEYKLFIKKGNSVYPYAYRTHPLDVVGWDGYVYPYAFSIHDFEPITGRVHQPPPVHQTFQAARFVVCSFVPRLYDYHPLAIPAPYNHSNIDSDELLYYVDGDFMSRKDVERGMFTLHPGGIPHGPHPGTVEKSIGARETHELAVMIDTFDPLLMTRQAAAIERGDYYLSWLS